MKKTKCYYALLKTDEKPIALSSEPTLKELQTFCNGYVEKINVTCGYVLANEEGRLKNMPINYTASQLYKTIILGDVVFVTDNYDWFQTVLCSRYYLHGKNDVCLKKGSTK